MTRGNIPIQPIILGRIGTCYGVRGWLKVFPLTEKTKDIMSYQPWFIQRKRTWKKIELEGWRYHNQGIIIKLKTFDNPNSAVSLTNHMIITDSSKLPTLPKGEYYWKDLIGCHVFTTEGYNLGKVVNIIETGSNDVLLVKANSKDLFNVRERLVPFIDEQVIKKINIFDRVIEVDWSPKF